LKGIKNFTFPDIDSINILLMLISLVLSLLYPFELFLFSYIVLGPLHYMTEISWLKERDFFINPGTETKSLFLVAILSIGIIIMVDLFDLGLITGLSEEGSLVLQRLFTVGLFVAFVLALILTLPLSKREKFLFGLASLGLGLFFSNHVWFIVIIGIFIPTLIHTTIFTGVFMLEGALKKKKLIGFLALLVFIICNGFFFLYPSIDANILTSEWVQNLFLDSDFYYVNLNFYNLFYASTGETFVLDSSIGTRIQGFIAFAYTYHYLNWFSKTKIIKWHLTPRPWLVFSVVVWGASIALHIIDMKVGILFIATLSLLHVYLEFPLNHRSFRNIGSIIFRDQQV